METLEALLSALNEAWLVVLTAFLGHLFWWWQKRVDSRQELAHQLATVARNIQIALEIVRGS